MLSRAVNLVKGLQGPSLQRVSWIESGFGSKGQIPIALKCTGASLNVREVLEASYEPVREVKEGEVVVDWVAAPVHPADINMLEGNYGVIPEPPYIPGNEGVGIISRVGPGVEDLSVGTAVLPLKTLCGTWSKQAVVSAVDVARVPSGLTWAQAAALVVNPGTALRMLEDFSPPGGWKEGDLVAQNAANGQVGRAVVGLAASMGLRTLNVIRERATSEATEALKKELIDAGAWWVGTSEEMLADRVGSKEAKLAFNAVGGSAVSSLESRLETGGTMVTYGGMSKRAGFLRAGSLIFRDIVHRGFWVSRWRGAASREEQTAMWEKLASAVRSGSIHPEASLEFVPWSDWETAFDRAQVDQRGTKLAFSMREISLMNDMIESSN